MSKRFITVTAILGVMLIPSAIWAGTGHQFVVGKAATVKNTVVVPLVVTNEANLAAIDIPLKYSEGVTLREVNFENTRVAYFDLKIFNINNAERTVIIGLLPQMSATPKPDLDAGTGPVANLVFEVSNPTVNQIKVETFEMQNPGHFLAFVYHDFDQNGVPHIRTERPVFEPVTVAFSGVAAGPEVPAEYALRQNYPNPFNPSTDISFDLPTASTVELTVFNVLGQKVETLASGQMEAGSHTLTWDATPYSSGVYFYRISANGFSETKKMLMLK
ncbi:MAG TPA: T9SS type A sorting domain-containing protein [Candidatus Deferrimicrobium sp.]|nr:T9SS type A sorting domain-containing protein [Candidatus Deferrimicrobium sp.]